MLGSCYQTIDKPQEFHRYVHKPLGIKEPHFNKREDFDPDDVKARDKKWRFLFSCHELQNFMDEREESLKFTDQEISEISSVIRQHARDFHQALEMAYIVLEDKFIDKGYFAYSGYDPKSDGLIQYGKPFEQDGKTHYFQYHRIIGGGIRNMLAMTMSVAKMVPGLVKYQARKSFSDMNTFIEQVKKVASKNIDFLTGLSQLDISLLFKMLNIMGNNHKELANQKIYEFKEKYFTLDDAQNPTRMLPFKNLAIRILKAFRKDPSYSNYGRKQKVDTSKIQSYGCPAIFVRTKDGKQNMMEYVDGICTDVLNRTVFNNLDKWISLNGKKRHKNIDPGTRNSPTRVSGKTLF